MSQILRITITFLFFWIIMWKIFMDLVFVGNVVRYKIILIKIYECLFSENFRAFNKNMNHIFYVIVR